MKMRIVAGGRVQGVGFRYTTYQIAVSLGVTGSVKNESNGNVTIQAIGTKEQLEDFVEQVKHPSNPFAKVKILEQTEDETIENFEQFRVIY